MTPYLFYSHIVILVLLWFWVMRPYLWPSRGVGSHRRPVEPEPITPKRQQSSDPKPFTGLTHKPPCALCGQETAHTQPPPPVRPDPMPPTNQRPRTVDTSAHFCPHVGCDYRGWLG